MDALPPSFWQRRLVLLPALLFLFMANSGFAQPPTGYYNSAEGLTGTQLRNALHAIIDDHQRYPYTSTATDTWDLLSAADQDPANSSNIIDIYRNRTYLKSNQNSSTNPGGWSREHSWPSSYGFTNDGGCNYPFTDAHHLRAVDQPYNSSRGNRLFALSPTGTVYPVDVLPFANYGDGSGSTGSWEVWENRKGDIARSMLYMDVRYEGGTHSITGCAEPNLILTDNRTLVVSNTSSNLSTAYMGLLSTLLAWHLSDPPDASEIQRNNVVFSYQGNRNPFVDRPEFVCALWGITGCTVPSSGIDVSGYTIDQHKTGSTLSITLPTGTTIPEDGVLVVGRDATKAQFESFWGALPANAVYVNGKAVIAGNGFPVINGGQEYRLRNGSGVAVEPTSGYLPSGGVVANNTHHRNATNGTAFTAQTSPNTTASPGVFSGTKSGTGKVVFTEFADATGTGNFIYEFVELYYDATGGSTPPTVATFTSVAAEDGYITELSATSETGSAVTGTGTTLRVGDDSTRKAIRSILSFDTSSIPDTATIVSASVKLTQTSVSSTPFSTLGTLTLDLGVPDVGTSTALLASDWQGAVSVTSAATVPAPAANGSQVTATLNSTAAAQVNKTGRTQFKMRFTTQDDGDSTNDYINFASQEYGTVSYRPVLVVEYTN